MIIKSNGNIKGSSTINETEKQIIQDMTIATQQDWGPLLQKWLIDIYKWLNKARAYVASQNSVIEKLSSSLVITNKTGKQEINLVEINSMKKMRISKKNINNKEILWEGYKLLNEIGETLRGEEIMYSITFTKTGEVISNSNEVYTWTVPMSEFFNLVRFSETRITLKDSSTIYKMMQKQIQGNEKDAIIEKWTEQKIQDYALFNDEVRNNPNWEKWHKINEGNMLESYLRLLRNGGTVQDRDRVKKDSEYWHKLGTAVSSTMKAPDAFFKGGDIDNKQIKGLHASVTNINTLILNLQKVFAILKNAKINEEVLNKYYKKSGLNLEQQQKEVEQEVINKLTDFFTSKIDRNINTIIEF